MSIYDITHSIPMLNPDGVYLGNYRANLMGFDLNRHWLEPSQWAHPTIYATKNYVLEFDQSKNCELDFFIDIHAHSTLMGAFLVGCGVLADCFFSHKKSKDNNQCCWYNLQQGVWFGYCFCE